MVLKRLRLHDFRSYQQLSLTPPSGVTVFVGENGAGKTNLLEAIHLCCLGRSHRTSNDRDMIREGAETCAVHAKVETNMGTDEVGVRLYAKQRSKKMIYVNGKIVGRIGELMGHMTCVMFSPEDLEIIKGGPANRRRYLDMLLSQCQPAYFYAIQTYLSVLKQRNALLKAIARGESRRQLDVWDEQLAAACVPIVRLRQQTAIKLNALVKKHYAAISSREHEILTVRLSSQLGQSMEPQEDLARLLRQSRDDDLRRLSTSCGPHRDDLDIFLKGHEIKAQGSQGQMRTAALALRLSEMDILTDMQNEPPLLLLDDVLSELDIGRRSMLILQIRNVQTLITCTDMKDLKGAKPDCVLTVDDGFVR